MVQSPLHISLPTPEATARYAMTLGAALGAADVVLLDGPVGAGKTHFARCLIQSLLVTPEDVPSPTFTLVQTYDTTAGPVWHCDLYRIISTSDIEELGLLEAFDDAITLVEWPDRLGSLAPARALTLTLAQGDGDDARVMTAKWQDRRWDLPMQDWANL